MISLLTRWLRPKPQPAPAAPGLTLAELTRRFLASRRERNLRETTVVNYASWTRAVAREYGQRPAAAFTVEDFHSLLAAHSRSYGETWKAMWRWAVYEHLVPVDVTAGVIRRHVHGDSKPPAYLSPSEAQRFYAAIRDEFKAPFALAMYAGLRPMEVCRIDWSAINIRERRIRIEPAVSKIRRARFIEDVPTILWAQLALYEQHEGPLIPRCAQGGSQERPNMQFWINERARAGAVAHVPLAHDVLRHSFATYFVAHTGSPDRVAKILGHHDLRMLATHYDGVATKQEAEQYFHPKPILGLPLHSSTAEPTDSP